MAKVKQASSTFNPKPRIKRPGVHAKTKSSKLKTSKLYKKISVGQG